MSPKDCFIGYLTLFATLLLIKLTDLADPSQDLNLRTEGSAISQRGMNINSFGFLSNSLDFLNPFHLFIHGPEMLHLMEKNVVSIQYTFLFTGSAILRKKNVLCCV